MHSTFTKITAGYCLHNPIDDFYYKSFINTASTNRWKLAQSTGIYSTALYYFQNTLYHPQYEFIHDHVPAIYSFTNKAFSG